MPDPSAKRNIVKALRELDHGYQQQQLGADAEQRLQGLIRDKKSSPSRKGLLWLPLGAAALAGLAALVFVITDKTTPPAPSPRKPPSKLAAVGGFSVISGHTRLREDDQLQCQSPQCTLRAAGTRIELSAKSRIDRLPRSTRSRLVLRQGRATFYVKPRPPQKEPLKVYVSHGRIEVLGTIFTVLQEPDKGEVQLRKGSIRFVSNAGVTIKLAQGETLRWPLKPKSKTDPVLTKPVVNGNRPATTKLSVEEVESLYDQVARLRNQARYHEAAKILRQSLPRVSGQANRESFSYELGVLLSDHIKDPRAACAHWKKHLRKYGTARYGKEIRQAQTRLNCPQRSKE